MRVAVTQAAPRGAELAEALRRVGFEAEACPLVRVEALDGPPIRLAGYDWLLLTSRNAVGPLLARVDDALPPVAVVGPGTAEALRAHGVEPSLVARRSSQEGLVEELPQPVGRVLFAGAEGARDLLVRELGADFVPLYRTVEERPARFPDADLVVLASASAARSLAALGLGRPCVALGPLTADEARRHGLEVVAEAESQTPEGLAAVVKLAASRIASSRS